MGPYSYKAEWESPCIQFEITDNALGHTEDGPSSRNDDSGEEEPSSGPQTLEGSVFTFSDGSRWELAQPLSHRQYQQTNPPFEARQVFECICIEGDRNGKYQENQEVVMKVKYQVYGTLDSTLHYWSNTVKCRERLAQSSKNSRGTIRHTGQDKEDALYEVEHADDLCFLATEPASSLNEDTERELNALNLLKNNKCAHGPLLMEKESTRAHVGFDEQAMPGGYAIFMLMTKVPGELLNQDTFRKMSKDDREEVRQVFKVAMLNLWECGVWPQGCDMRNMMWDKEERKLYFVDFAKSVEFNDGLKAGTVWSEQQYEAWGLAEGCNPACVR